MVFKPAPGKSITIFNNATKQYVTEQSYVLDSVFFWTMPTGDLEIARKYWENIRTAVLTDNITSDAFWSLSDHKNFHVRPKARVKIDQAINPNGGYCDKFCYWFNAEYVKQIIDNTQPHE